MANNVYALKYQLGTKQVTEISEDMFFNSANSINRISEPCLASAKAESIPENQILISAEEFLKYPPIPVEKKNFGAVIGTDTRTLINDTEKYPNKWVFYILVTFNNSTYRGTGFAMGRQLVMTCAHMVYSRGDNAWPSKIQAYSRKGNQFQLISDGEFVIRSKKYETDGGDDWGLILLKNEQSTGKMGLTCLNTCPVEECAVTGFPAEVRGVSTSNMWTDSRVPENLSGVSLQYKINTSGGNSGSPVHMKKWQDIDKAYACAVHYAGAENYMNYGRAVDTKLFDLICWINQFPNFDHELFSTNWNLYYSSQKSFVYNNKAYLFGHSPSDNRWFVSEYNETGHHFEHEVASGNWNNYYSVIEIFTYEGKLYMFGHSSSHKRWFVSEFNTQTKDFDHEVASGNWNNYYSVIRLFTYNNKLYMFGHTQGCKRWFVSDFNKENKNFEHEVSSGNWNNFYGQIEIFTVSGKTCMLGQSQNENRWFLSELREQDGGINFDHELFQKNWARYYQTLRIFQMEGYPYLFGHTATDKRWFISRLDLAGSDAEQEVSSGNWQRFYGTIELVKINNQLKMYGQADSDKRWFLSEFRI